MREILLQYVKYNFWANQKLIEACNGLTIEQLNQEILGSFPSIQKTMYHIWMAESIWIQRLNLVEHIILPESQFSGSFKEAMKLWLKVSKEYVTFVEKQFDDRGFTHEIIYHTLKKEPQKSKVFSCIHQAMNHATFHRGQVVNQLRQIGITTIPNTDFITFDRLKK